MISYFPKREDANILVIDDEDRNLKLLKTLLEEEGYQNIVTLSDSRMVKPLYKTRRFDLIMLDINMPYLNGFQIIEQLKEFKHRDDELPPILVLTAEISHGYCLDALHKGARDYVTKPFDTSELVARVRNLLDSQMLHKYMRSQNSILEREVELRTREIYSTRLQIVRRLGLAAEYRDSDTGLHLLRMSKISVVIGKAAGLSDDDCDLLLNASPMHDIGKIGVPDYLLLKPAKYTKSEKELMESHTLIGAKILSGDDSELLTMARDIALSHHEKWDGSGYPNKLTGEEIPFVARIVSIADVFDALVSKRPYKKAWDINEAIQFIKDKNGTFFDPELVKIFVNNIEAIVAIEREHQEVISSKVYANH
jgi:putative two-component system response regulator